MNQDSTIAHLMISSGLDVRYDSCITEPILPKVSYIETLTASMSNPYDLEVLEQKHAMKVLVYLLENDMYKGELTSKITVGSASVQSRVAELVEKDLVREEMQKVKPFRKILSLTDKGRRVAELVKEIENLL